MPVLGAPLPGEEHELLRAVAVGVHVDEELKPDLGEPAEAEVGDLDLAHLVVAEDDARLAQLLGGVLAGAALLLPADHPDRRL
jgi:hypothetical protein